MTNESSTKLILKFSQCPLTAISTGFPTVNFNVQKNYDLLVRIAIFMYSAFQLEVPFFSPGRISHQRAWFTLSWIWKKYVFFVVFCSISRFHIFHIFPNFKKLDFVKTQLGDFSGSGNQIPLEKLISQLFGILFCVEKR